MFQILPHTADIRLLVKGETPEILFQSALEGMACLQTGAYGGKPDGTPVRQDQLQIRSLDQTALLIDFLSEVLTHSQVYKVVYCQVQFDQLSDVQLSATIFGWPVAEFEKDIKAVTYHEAEIHTDKDLLLTTMIIFDI